ncbi:MULTISPECIES: hypothetical protein [Halorubrum]|uniref:hypothetical protein n=1 Tax=Halorubrum TaxID=56688 RepID=UPI001EFA0445|nr:MULTISPECIES: hypothetical protein [Halorubrum]
MNYKRFLKRPVVRWGIAGVYLATSLLLLIVIGDLPRPDQIVVTVMCVIGFFILPSALKDFAESGPM